MAISLIPKKIYYNHNICGINCPKNYKQKKKQRENVIQCKSTSYGGTLHPNGSGF